jgi:hypothetical protein
MGRGQVAADDQARGALDHRERRGAADLHGAKQPEHRRDHALTLAMASAAASLPADGRRGDVAPDGDAM